MLCDNCGKDGANIKLTQIINDKKTEMMICKKCGEKLGISKIDFEMPIDISNFLEDFISEQGASEFMTFNSLSKELECKKCNMKYEEFLNNGKFGCEECYKTFENKIDILLKKIQGADKYLGRKANLNVDTKVQEIRADNKKEKLHQQLKQAIKEERYEDAARIRDEIKNLDI